MTVKTARKSVLSVNENEQFFVGNLLDFMEMREELVKQSLRNDSSNLSLSDVITEIRVILDLADEVYSAKTELIDGAIRDVFLLLAKGARKKIEYFQDKYGWVVPVEALETSNEGKEFRG